MSALFPARTSPLASALPFLALLAGGTAMGFSPIFVRLSDLAPLVSGFYRLALALPFIWLLSLNRSGPADDKPLTTRDHLLMIAAGLTFGADIATWHLAIANTSVTNAMLLSNTGPVMVTGAAFLLFGERVRPLFLTGLAVALAGVTVLAIQRDTGATAPHPFYGNVMAIAAAGFYAAYMLIVIALRKRHSTQRIMVYSTAVSALSLLPVALLSGDQLVSMTLFGWAVLFGMALISHVGGQGFFTYALAHLPASLSAMSQFIQTVVAAFVAWILLGESLTLTTLLCAIAILSGIFICRRASLPAGA